MMLLKFLGQPHSKSVNNENEWIYIERVLIKGEYHKLGKHILKENNVLVLNFDKFGILKDKKIINKDEKNKLVFTKNKQKMNYLKKVLWKNFFKR